jgi:hypothetical protein
LDFEGKGNKKTPTKVTKDGLADNYVHCVYRDQKGILWFGTNGGVSHDMMARNLQILILRMGWQANMLTQVASYKKALSRV